ncbi:pectinesterase-like [Salvia hispanica]|uniref:pectinesterase-like n=1 Tax=Salvia hispanica TaxID=49212 RepID=UPI0020095C85|nr:pectinesterase-like [Salvia hispanica]
MEKILKILIILAFLSLLVDAAVSTPASPEERSNFWSKITKITSKTSNVKIPNPKEIKKFLDKAKAKSQLPGITKNKNIKQAVRPWFRQQQQSRRPGRVSAFDDCIVMTLDSIDQIKSSVEIFEGVEWSKDGISSLNATQKVQLNNLLSAVQTNVATCLDGFSHSRAEKKTQAEILKADLMLLHREAGLLLSLADEMGGKDAKEVTKEVKRRRGEEWPEWLSADDRKLLQEEEVEADVTVAKNGPADYRTVAEAVAEAPEGSSKRYVIRIKAGRYMENVEIPKEKKNLTFVGDGYDKTFIIAGKNVIDGNTTFNSATVGVAGDGFLARDITFQNRAGPSKLHAVALRVNADSSAFYRCRMAGYQNTLYVHSFRQFYKQCVIVGTVDFIFGNAAVVFHSCRIVALRPEPNQNYTITAQRRSDAKQKTGIVIHNCVIAATPDAEGKSSTYLGRPWGKYSRTVVIGTNISSGIHPAGWSEWDGKFALDTLFYAEYNNTGAGAETKGRVNWKGIRKLKEVEAQEISSPMGFS